MHLKKQGFEVTPNADAWAERPHLIVFAGSMLRPAIEKTLEEFQKREGVPITTTYNGCGILVGQMKTGEKPDLYFACDPQFLHMVRDHFDEPTVISKNQLVIAVPKGNKHNLQALKDLGKPGLRVGVGHEQQCALGAITKETFLKTGTYAAVQKNIAVQAPSGDLLVVQLRGGSLDAVVAYQSNVTPYVNRIAGALLVPTGMYLAYYGWFALRVQQGRVTRDPIVSFFESIQNTCLFQRPLCALDR